MYALLSSKFSRAYALQTLCIALVGSLLAALSLPPMGWHLLVWVAPIPWLWLIGRESLPGKRPYLQLWLAGVVYWLLVAHWIRLPHPMNYLAWFAMCAYLGAYLPLFVALSRVGVWRVGLPLAVVAPVVWTGLDWIRGNFLTGFLMGSLAHSQFRVPRIIQTADLWGEYGVTFLIVLVASGLTSLLLAGVKFKASTGNFRDIVVPLALAVALPLGLAFSYASATLAKHASVSESPSPDDAFRIALIQGNVLADWKHDPEKQERIMRDHVELSREAVRTSRERDNREVDLVVWPETAFRQALLSVRDGFELPEGALHESHFTVARSDLAKLVEQLRCAVMVGIERIELYPSEEDGEIVFHGFNSAVLANNQGEIVAAYDKIHRVPFGEFIPFADWFPFLYQLTPLTGGIQAGKLDSLELLELEGFTLSASICYESAVPHLIRRQQRAIEERFERHPDVMVNLTNDAWFWGSSELDLHLACGVFRAVEMRTPLVIAANGGLSAHIDPGGVLRAESDREQADFLLVDVPRRTNATSSFYTRWGDWFALACLLCCVVLSVVGLRRR